MSEYLPAGARLHLIGICGTGMAALAGLLKECGYQVSGSDNNVYPPMSTLLHELGIDVKTPYSAANLDPAPDVVIIGNAMSRGNAEVEAVLDRALRYQSMAEALKMLCLERRRPLVVAGTHGKTTTTSMLAWIFEVAGQQDPQFRPGFLIGGKPGNFAYGFRAQPVSEGIFVIEGDEYDTAFFDKGPKFLHYLPRSIVLTSVEYDHADIYADLESVKLAFKRLVNMVPANGVIIAAESPTVEECVAKAFCPVERYGKSKNCMWRVENIEIAEDCTCFDIVHGTELLLRAELQMAGDHNVMNALGAVALATHYGIGATVVQQALRTFQGVKRRLEVRGEPRGITVIDDFAHHPTAIRETIQAVRQRFPGRRIWAILEPRSNTLRRRVFEKELVESLDAADHVTLAAVFQASSIPEAERLEIARVLDKLGAKASAFPNAEEIVAHVTPQLRKGDIVLIMSNGGFGGIHEKFLEALARS